MCAKISATKNYFFYKNNIASTKHIRLENDFAIFRQQIGRANNALFQCI